MQPRAYVREPQCRSRTRWGTRQARRYGHALLGLTHSQDHQRSRGRTTTWWRERAPSTSPRHARMWSCVKLSMQACARRRCLVGFARCLGGGCTYAPGAFSLATLPPIAREFPPYRATRTTVRKVRDRKVKAKAKARKARAKAGRETAGAIELIARSWPLSRWQYQSKNLVLGPQRAVPLPRWRLPQVLQTLLPAIRLRLSLLQCLLMFRMATQMRRRSPSHRMFSRLLVAH